MKTLTIPRGRLIRIPVSLGEDVSLSTFKSEIRVSDDISSGLITFWEVAFLTDGTDGELVLTLVEAKTASVTQDVGYMDIIRIDGSSASQVGEVIEVHFTGSVTENV